MQAGNVTGDIHFHHTEPVPAQDPAPRQLPADVHAFVNRSHELGRLDAVLADRDAQHAAVSVHVVAGTAGAGKTSLVLHWAHQTKDHFPDGQLFVNLRGYDPGQPVTPEPALRRFLRALGIPTTDIPQDPDDAAALYRSLLAPRRMLIVLDNAATTAQVRPLLPGSGNNLVLITSRSRLSGLAVRDGAHRLTLGTLPQPEAIALLQAVTNGYRPTTTNTTSPNSPACAPTSPSPCASPPNAPPPTPTSTSKTSSPTCATNPPSGTPSAPAPTTTPKPSAPSSPGPTAH